MPRQARAIEHIRSKARDADSMKALHAASEAAMRGDWQRCADSYRQAYIKSAKDWDLRYNCISGFTSVLSENHFKAREEDLQFLQALAKDEEAPALYRATASFTRGLMLWLSQDREGAKRNYRKAIRIAESASNADRERKEILSAASGLELTSMDS